MFCQFKPLSFLPFSSLIDVTVVVTSAPWGERRWADGALLLPLKILQKHKHKDVDIGSVATEFARLKGRRLALCF